MTNGVHLKDIPESLDYHIFDGLQFVKHTVAFDLVRSYILFCQFCPW